MIEIINDKKEWSTQLSMAQHFDFYHTYDYHHLSKNDDESPILIKYTDGFTTLILPLLLRSIKNTEYKDATSVYGYAGVLILSIDKQFKKENFHKELIQLFNENNIIAVFSRLHPFLETEESILDDLGKITSLGYVVNIDLTDSIENQRAKFNRRLKTYLNKSRRSCTVIEGNISEHLELFIELYNENMKRVDADDCYFFETDYYHKLLSSEDIDSSLMLCKHNETQEIIAGAIFLKTGDIVQYHLSGLSEEYFELNPIKLIIDEMRIQATHKGFTHFNLGGGLGSKEDSLFQFKSSFSKNYKTFKIWKYIVNEDIYKILAENHLKTQLKNEDLDKGYFPAYRAPI